MGILYVVGVPAGAPDDISLRARRILEKARLVVADDIAQARRLLAQYDLAPPLVSSASPEPILSKLEASDVVLLFEGQWAVPAGASVSLILAAIESGCQVVPVPGPSLPVTALVMSGLPADSFIYLGELPEQPGDAQALFAAVAGERRTIIVLADAVPSAPSQIMSSALLSLSDTLGNRLLTVTAASDQGVLELWRGRLHDWTANRFDRLLPGPYILVISGAQETESRWDEEQLESEIQVRLAQGLGAKEISRQLALESGWSRRQIYTLAAQYRSSPHVE